MFFIEAGYANDRKVPMVPIILQKRYRADGWLGLMLSSVLYYDLTDKNKYEKKLQEFLLDVRKKQKDQGVPTQGAAITTRA